MKKLLEPFSFNFGQLQDISTLLKHLKDNDKTVGDFIDFIESESSKRVRDAEKLKEKFNKFALKCPRCGTAMGLYAVNITPATQTGDDSKSVWVCANSDCMETIYNKQSIQEIIEERS